MPPKLPAQRFADSRAEKAFIYDVVDAVNEQIDLTDELSISVYHKIPRNPKVSLVEGDELFECLKRQLGHHPHVEFKFSVSKVDGEEADLLRIDVSYRHSEW